MFRSSFLNRQKHAKRGKRFSIREHAADADSFSIKYNLKSRIARQADPDIPHNS